MFDISLTGVEGGRSDMPISMNDPFFGVRDDIANNRLKYVYNQADPLDLSQQRLLQLLENQAGMGGGLYGNPSVNEEGPSTTPFPIGCPTGMYQQGNVCIPIVGTYPGEYYGAPPAGQNFAKGRADDVIPDNVTERGKKFEVSLFMTNIGAIRGKFGTKVHIPLLNLELTSKVGWVPQYSPAIIFAEGTMPNNAPFDTSIPCTVELLRLDEVSGDFEVDDVLTFNLQSPSVDGPQTPGPDDDPVCFTIGGIQYCEVAGTPNDSTCLKVGTTWYCPDEEPPDEDDCLEIGDITYCVDPTPPTDHANCFKIDTRWYCAVDDVPEPANCITVGTPGVQMCKSNTWRSGCALVNNVIYCPATTPPPTPNPQDAYIVTEPSDSQQDADPFKVKGFNFSPGERVDITAEVDWEPSRHGTWRDTDTVTADSSGRIFNTFRSEDVPSDVEGDCIITARGRSSGKTAQTSIHLY